MLNRVVRVRTRIATERFGREFKLNLSKIQDVVPAQNIGERATVMNATVRESLGEDEELRTCRLQACSYSGYVQPIECEMLQKVSYPQSQDSDGLRLAFSSPL